MPVKSAYSVREVLVQEPAAICAVLSHGFAVAVGVGILHWSAYAVGAINALALSVLTLFYIRPLTSSHDALDALARPPEPVVGWGVPEQPPGD